MFYLVDLLDKWLPANVRELDSMAQEALPFLGSLVCGCDRFDVCIQNML